MTRAKRIFILCGLLAVPAATALFFFAAETNIDWDMRQRRNQKSAYLDMRNLGTAIERYRIERGTYPPDLEPVHEMFVNQVATSFQYADRDYGETCWKRVQGQKNYKFVYRLLDSSGYELTAVPSSFGETGFRGYYKSAGEEIRWRDMEPASSSDAAPDIDPILDLHSYWTKRARR